MNLTLSQRLHLCESANGKLATVFNWARATSAHSTQLLSKVREVYPESHVTYLEMFSTDDVQWSTGELWARIDGEWAKLETCLLTLYNEDSTKFSHILRTRREAVELLTFIAENLPAASLAKHEVPTIQPGMSRLEKVRVLIVQCEWTLSRKRYADVEAKLVELRGELAQLEEVA